MSYYYGPGLGALGFSDPRGNCTEVENGETRCFRLREAGSARSRDCVSLTRDCEVGGDDGTIYCCPQYGTTRAPGTPPSNYQNEPTEEPRTMIGQGWNWFQEVIGAKEQGVSEQSTPMPGSTPSGKPTAAGFSAYAQEAAIRETAAVEEEQQAPIQEAPEDSSDVEQNEESSWIEQYQSHITLASTVIGLGTFIIWLMVRKKD